MKGGHGIKTTTVAKIVDVLRAFPEVKRAILFGSRAKGTHRPGSDIDLALYGDGLDWRALGRIDDALDDLMLPYRFSLIALDERTDQAVAAHVRRVGSVLYEQALGVDA